MKHAGKSWAVTVMAIIGIVVFGAVLLVQTLSFTDVVESLAESDIRERTAFAATMLAKPLKDGDMAAVRRFCDDRHRQGIRVTIVEPDGSVAYDTDAITGNHLTRDEIHRAFTGEVGVVRRKSETLGSYQLYCARKSGNRVVRLAVPYNGVLEPVRLAKHGFMTAGIVGAMVVSLIFILTRSLSGRLDEQTQALKTAEANERFRREFTANVTHELKTPITAIAGAVEMIGDGTMLDADERHELMDIIHDQAKRLNALVRDVLALAQIEREQTESHPDFVPIPLEKIIDTVATLESGRARQSNIQLKVKKNDPATVIGDPHLIEQAIVNLVENAFRYSGAERIDINSRVTGNMAEISVTDYGIGIPAEHLPHLFNRFYRVDRARSRSLGGTGLGLAIVKHIAILHGGQVSVESSPGDRTTFTVRLPVSRIGKATS